MNPRSPQHDVVIVGASAAGAAAPCCWLETETIARFHEPAVTGGKR